MNLENNAAGILLTQLEAVKNITISPQMIEAIEEIVKCRNNNGRIITTGMGKAGIIATKMSATLASIGFPSFFVSPAEAGHGDLGRIAPEDLVIVFSNSGSTKEVLSMIVNLHKLNKGNNKIIAVTGADVPKIPSNIIVSYGKVKESCVVSKVPSTSTTVMLIIADIIAITAAESMGLNDDWFKIRHPGGAIGESYQNSSGDRGSD